MEKDEFYFTQNSIFDYYVEQYINIDNNLNIDTIKPLYDHLYNTLTACERRLLFKYKKLKEKKVRIKPNYYDVYDMCTIIGISFILNTDFFLRMTTNDSNMYNFIEYFPNDTDNTFKIFYDFSLYEKSPVVFEIVNIHLDNLYTFQSKWKYIENDVYEPVDIISYDDIDKFKVFFSDGLNDINSFSKFFSDGLNNINSFRNSHITSSNTIGSTRKKRYLKPPRINNNNDERILSYLDNKSRKDKDTRNDKFNKNRNDQFNKNRNDQLTNITDSYFDFPGGYKKNKTKKYYKNKTKKYYKNKLHKKYIKK